MFKVPVLCSLGNVNVLHIDGEQIQKVIVNMLLNANEAVVGDGQISISTFRDGGWAKVAVSDTGCGMSREFIETRLFKPFQTTKPKGMGIGLFHCKTIVEAHGGRIEVECEEGERNHLSGIITRKASTGSASKNSVSRIGCNGHLAKKIFRSCMQSGMKYRGC